MDRDDDGETSYNTFVDDVAIEPTYLQALPTAAGRNVATINTFYHFITVRYCCRSGVFNKRIRMYKRHKLVSTVFLITLKYE